MKLSMMALAASMAFPTVVFAANFGEGYNERLHESRRTPGGSAVWVYLNHPSEYQGSGYLAECQKVSTYSGGPKTGAWRTYFVCRVAH